MPSSAGTAGRLCTTSSAAHWTIPDMGKCAPAWLRYWQKNKRADRPNTPARLRSRCRVSGCDETAGQSGRDDLTPRIFRALYQDFDLLTIGVIHIVTPKGTPGFIADSLPPLARQIRDHDP